MAGSVWIWSDGGWHKMNSVQVAIADVRSEGVSSAMSVGDSQSTATNAGLSAAGATEHNGQIDNRAPSLGSNGYIPVDSANGDWMNEGLPASVDDGPASGDAGFVMPGNRSEGSGVDRQRSDPERTRVSVHSSSGKKASRPADFWLLRGSAQLSDEESVPGEGHGKRKSRTSGGGELPAAIRERLTQAGLFVWTPDKPLWSLREYAVPVFHLDAVAVERVYRPSDKRSRPSGQEDRERALQAGERSPLGRDLLSGDSPPGSVRGAGESGVLRTSARTEAAAEAGIGKRQKGRQAAATERRASLPTGFHIDPHGEREAGQRGATRPAEHMGEAEDSELPRQAEQASQADLLPTRSSNSLVRRAVKTAIRALYALGLDYGEVRIVLDGEGRAAVRTILPLSEHHLHGDVGKAVLACFAEDYATARRVGGSEPLKIGADPEFVLLRRDGRIVSPSRFLDPHGAAGCDTVVVGRTVRHPVAELSPDPASDPAELAAHVRRLLHRAAARITMPDLRWLAGGMPVPGLGLGGHIHFSGVWLSNRLLRMLDSCVAFPLALVEDPAGRKRRPRYGGLGDYRLQPHGFEYRTPPSWLVSPMAAQAAFALGMLAVRELWPLSASYGTLPAEQPELVAAYYMGDRELLHEGMRSFLELITRTPSYRELGRFISPLLAAIRSGATWDEQVDLRLKWKLPTEALR